VLLVAMGSEAATLAPLPVRKLPGIGPVSERGCTRSGSIRSRTSSPHRSPCCAPSSARTRRASARPACGKGSDELGSERPAFREHDPRGVIAGTISNERTFVETTAETAREILSGLSSACAREPRRRGVVAGHVTLKLRYTDFQTLTRGRTSRADEHRRRGPSRGAGALPRAAEPGRCRSGCSVSRWRSSDPTPWQLPLFDGGEPPRPRVDRVREKYGYDAVHLATTLGSRRRN